MTCTEHYPDIYTPPPSSVEPSDPILEEIQRRNAAHKKLYLAVRKLLREQFSFDVDGGTSQEPRDFPGGFKEEEKVFFASVYGLLLARDFDDPSAGRAGRSASPRDVVFKQADTVVHIADTFVEALTDSVKVHNANRSMFRGVFKEIQRLGTIQNGTSSSTLYTTQLAQVSQRLIDDGVDPKSPHLPLLTENALSVVIGGSVEGNSAGIPVRLPDLDTGTAVEIIPDNVRAVALIYFSAMLEEWKLYSVTEKVVEHFMIGMLPIQRSSAGQKVFEWLKAAPQRLTEIERRGIYGRVLGLAQGNVKEGMPNREFSDLWVRSLSMVSILNRDALSTNKKEIDAQQVQKTFRDLGVNLSLHGYGIAHFAAVEMQQLVREMKEMLSAPELLRAYGVNDYAQLVERVSAMYLGGARNGVRYRTMAQSGAEIMLWLAARANQLSSMSSRVPNSVNFLDPLLVYHVEQWLAVTGTPDATVEKFADPVDLQAQPTIPTILNGGIGQQVRNVLEQAGVGALPGIPQA